MNCYVLIAILLCLLRYSCGKKHIELTPLKFKGLTKLRTGEVKESLFLSKKKLEVIESSGESNDFVLVDIVPIPLSMQDYPLLNAVLSGAKVRGLDRQCLIDRDR